MAVAKFSFCVLITTLLVSLNVYSLETIGTIEHVHGFIYTKDPGEKKKFLLASKKEPISLNQKIKTTESSVAVLRIKGGYQIKLLPETTVNFEVAPTPDNPQLNISLETGGLYLYSIGNKPNTDNKKFLIRLGPYSITGQTGKLFMSHDISRDEPPTFLHSKSVTGEISRPKHQTKAFTSDDSYLLHESGTQKLQKKKNKKWVEKLIWTFDSQVEPRFYYKLDFPQLP